MTYTDPSTINHSAGFQEIFLYVNNVTDNIFVAMLLLSIFVITAIGSYMSAKRLSGEGNFPVSFAVAGYITVGCAFLMMLIDGFIPLVYVMITIVIAVVGSIWLYFTKEK